MLIIYISRYGPTGSGKTYTMEGHPNNEGVFHLAIEEIFSIKKYRSQDCEYQISISLMEIYNESIVDLLDYNPQKKLDIKQGSFGNYVPDLKITNVDNPNQVYQILNSGKKNRSVAFTNMNEHSSRSHLVYTIYIDGKNIINNGNINGKLHLIDLAGSERLKQSNAQGETQKESISINKSLSSLTDVIQAKINKNSHIPFRNSTLTYFLQDSLSNSSKTVMILQVSPAINYLEQTLSSLQFANRIKQVELGEAKKIKKK